jgi:hypothetical protein
MTGGWGRTALLAHNFPVLVFQSKYSTDAFAGIGYDNSTGLKFYVNSATSDVVGAANHAMTILDNTNVGIGTQTPSSKLTVDSGTTNTAYSPTSFNTASQIKINVASTQNNYAGIQFTHAGNTEGFIGLVRTSTTVSDADFVIQSYTTSVGYTEKLRIDKAGTVTMPYQPAFTVMGSGSWTAMSSASTVLVTGWSTVTQRGGANFVSSTGKFTAPVAGWYMFTFQSYTRVDSPSTGSHIYVRIYKNGAGFGSTGNIQHYGNAGDADTGTSHSSLIQMAANDYVQAAFRAESTGCSYHHGSQNFTGYLVG